MDLYNLLIGDSGLLSDLHNFFVGDPGLLLDLYNFFVGDSGLLSDLHNFPIADRGPLSDRYNFGTGDPDLYGQPTAVVTANGGDASGLVLEVDRNAVEVLLDPQENFSGKLLDRLTCGGAEGSMKRVLATAVLGLVLLSAGPSFGQAQPKELPAVMVLNIKHEEDASSGLAAILTDLVLQGVHDLKQFRVVGQKDVNQMLSMEQQKQLAGCSDTSCLIEIAGALGTKYTIDGTVGIVGSSNILSLTLLDTTKAAVVSRKTAIIKGEREQLLGSVSKLLRDLMEPVSKASSPSPPTTVSTPTATKEYPMNPYKFWGHVGAWSGLGVVGLGGLFSALNKKAVDEYNTGKNPSSSKDDINTYRPLAITAYVLGSALVATGAALWILSPGDEAWTKEHKIAFDPSVDGNFTGFYFTGAW